MPKVAIINTNREFIRKFDENLSKVANKAAKAKNIVIKPNLCSLLPSNTGTTTDVNVVRYLIKWLKEKNPTANITIAEADATSSDVEVNYKMLGYEDLAKEEDVELLNLCKDEKCEIELNGLHFRSLELPEKIISSDFFISVSKLKTHVLTTTTLTLKNLFGCIPVKRKVRFHKDLLNVILDVNKAIPPDLSIIDGIIGMEGKGPNWGMPKRMNVIVVGDDSVAVDAVGSRIMGFNPWKIKHIKLAHKLNIGSLKSIELFGTPLKYVQTKFVRGDTIFQKSIQWFLRTRITH